MTAFSLEQVVVVLGERQIDISSEFPKFAPAIAKTGIEKVHQTSGTAIDLAVQALQIMLHDRPEVANEVGALLVVSQSSPMQLPSMAFEIQDRCGVSKEILAVDINQGCSGFVQALQFAVSCLSWAKSVLIVCTDTYRSKLHPEDRSTNAVFSDAATAILVTNRPSLRVLGSAHHSDGSGRHLLYQSLDPASNFGRLHMSGSEVWLFTKRVVFNQIAKMIDASSLAMSDIDEIFLHQASELVLGGLQTQFGPGVRVPRRLKTVGNTVSSSIPILICDRLEDLPRQVSVFCGFGVGLSCSSLLIGPT